MVAAAALRRRDKLTRMGGRSDDKRAKEPRPEPNLELPSFRLRRKPKPAPEASPPAVEASVVEPEASAPAVEASVQHAPPPPPPVRKAPAPPTAKRPVPPPPMSRKPPAPPVSDTAAEATRVAPVVAPAEPTPVIPAAQDAPAKPPKTAKPPKAPKPPKPAKEPKAPRAPKAPKPPKAPKEKRERATTPLPWLPGYVAAIVTGALCGGLTVLLAWATGQGCSALRGVGTCGGYGVFALVAILGIDVVIATGILRLCRVVDPATTALLGVGLVAVLAMVFFLGSTQSVAMVYVIPLLMAATFAFAWWITKAIAQRVED